MQNCVDCKNLDLVIVKVCTMSAVASDIIYSSVLASDMLEQIFVQLMAEHVLTGSDLNPKFVFANAAHLVRF